MLNENSLKAKFFELSKESSIWIGVITLVIMIGQKLFTDSLKTETMLLLISLVVIALLFQGYLISSAVQKDFFNKIHDLESFIKDNGMDKIVSERSLGIIEKNAKEVWVFTKDLKNDLPKKNDTSGKFISNAVERNLKDGKEYTYFVPDTLRGKINEYRSKYKKFVKNKEQVKFILVKHEYFHFTSEIAFYDPYENYDETVQVVQYFPDDNVNYYIGYDKNYQSDFFGKASWLLNNDQIANVEYCLND